MRQPSRVEGFYFLHQRIFGGLRGFFEPLVEDELLSRLSRLADLPVRQAERVVGGSVVPDDPASPLIRLNRGGPFSPGRLYATKAQVGRRQAGIPADRFLESLLALLYVSGFKKQLAEAHSRRIVTLVEFQRFANMIDGVVILPQPCFDVPQIVGPAKCMRRQA